MIMVIRSYVVRNATRALFYQRWNQLVAGLKRTKGRDESDGTYF